MNLSESIGFFGESSSKIINTSILGEIKLEIVFTSQIACCIAGSAVPAATPIYAQAAVTLEDQNNTGSTNTGAVADIIPRRINIQKFSGNFTTGDTGIATAGNSNAAFDEHDAGAQGQIVAETNVYNISNIILHIEAYQFKTSDYYNVMKSLIESGKYR